MLSTKLTYKLPGLLPSFMEHLCGNVTPTRVHPEHICMISTGKSRSSRLCHQHSERGIGLGLSCEGTDRAGAHVLPLPLPLQQVGEVVAFAHVVRVLVLLSLQLIHCATVALLCQQQLLQHASVRLLLLLLKPVQLRKQRRGGVIFYFTDLGLQRAGLHFFVW